MTVPGAVVDPDRITSGEVTIPWGETRLSAFLATPVSEARRGGVVVVHEAFGAVPHVRDLARRFANVGFDAVAPDLYSRLGPPDPDDIPKVIETMQALPDAEAVDYLERTAQFLRSLDAANGRVGCIGFCSGGRQALLAACVTDRFDAAVSCWPGFLDRASTASLTTPARPTPAIDLVGGLSCPLLLVGGAEDTNPTPELLRRVADRVPPPARESVQVRTFEGAGHAFLADYRDTYRDGPAHALWPEILAFFHAHLGDR